MVRERTDVEMEGKDPRGPEGKKEERRGQGTGTGGRGYVLGAHLHLCAQVGCVWKTGQQVSSDKPRDKPNGRRSLRVAASFQADQAPAHPTLMHRTAHLFSPHQTHHSADWRERGPGTRRAGRPAEDPGQKTGGNGGRSPSTSAHTESLRATWSITQLPDPNL